MKDAFDILDSYELGEMPGVCHCFVGTPKEAERLKEMGFLFGIGGLITQRRLKDLRESINVIPLESIIDVIKRCSLSEKLLSIFFLSGNFPVTLACYTDSIGKDDFSNNRKKKG